VATHGARGRLPRAVALLAGLAGVCVAQEARIPGSATSPEEAGTSTGRFSAARRDADLKREAYLRTDTREMAEIDRLLRTRNCHLDRVVPRLNAAIEAMNAWLAAERLYWGLWNDSEGRRVVDLRAILASLEADAGRIAHVIEAEQAGLQELVRLKARLEAGPHTAEVPTLLDGITKDIRETEARLDHAHEEQDSVRVRIRELNASIAARLPAIGKNLSQLEVWQIEQDTYYAGRHLAADELCQLREPAVRPAPASAGGKGN
jgi:hypothetical protein